MTVLGFLAPWAWRWVGVAAVAGSAALAFYWKGVQHESTKFEAYKAEVKAAGDRQNALARAQEKSWKELADANQREADLRAGNLRAQLAAARLRVAALASSSIVPETAGPAAVRGRVCYSEEQLDRGLREALGILYRDVTGLAEEGERARALAADCVGYVRSIVGRPP